MLDQYILKQLEENDLKLEKLNNKLKMLCREEESCFNMIQKLQDQEDVGLELFSPRNPDDSTRYKISQIKRQVDSIKMEQETVSDEIEQAKSEEDKYQKMLLESRSKSVHRKNRDLESCGVMTEEGKEELKNILTRVDKCLTLLCSDKGQCKHELTNMKYYLKALISKS